MRTQQTIEQAEALGFTEASEQIKTQGCFSSGLTWDDNPELNEAYDRGVNKAEATAKATQPTHSPLPWLYFEDRNGSDLMDIDGNHIARIENTEHANPEANAAYIVRACNNAERLAEALQGWQDWADGKRSWPKLETNEALKSWKDAK